MIAKITRISVCRYTDNGQVTAYAEWVDDKGVKGRTEGTAHYTDREHYAFPSPAFGTHMHALFALFARGKREGLRLERETW